MGPKMCALAGADYDGAFFNWMTPEFAAGAREQVEAGAAEADRRPPPVFGYVRTAVGADAEERLAKEEALLPRPPRRLPQPLRPPRRARGHGRGRGGESAAGQARRAKALDVVVRASRAPPSRA